MAIAEKKSGKPTGVEEPDHQDVKITPPATPAIEKPPEKTNDFWTTLREIFATIGSSIANLFNPKKEDSTAEVSVAAPARVPPLPPVPALAPAVAAAPPPAKPDAAVDPEKIMQADLKKASILITDAFNRAITANNKAEAARKNGQILVAEFYDKTTKTYKERVAYVLRAFIAAHPELPDKIQTINLTAADRIEKDVNIKDIQAILKNLNTNAIGKTHYIVNAITQDMPEQKAIKEEYLAILAKTPKTFDEAKKHFIEAIKDPKPDPKTVATTLLVANKFLPPEAIRTGAGMVNTYAAATFQRHPELIKTALSLPMDNGKTVLQNLSGTAEEQEVAAAYFTTFGGNAKFRAHILALANLGKIKLASVDVPEETSKVAMATGAVPPQAQIFFT